MAPFILQLKHSNGAFEAFRWLQKAKTCLLNDLAYEITQKLHEHALNAKSGNFLHCIWQAISKIHTIYHKMKLERMNE